MPVTVRLATPATLPASPDGSVALSACTRDRVISMDQKATPSYILPSLSKDRFAWIRAEETPSGGQGLPVSALDLGYNPWEE